MRTAILLAGLLLTLTLAPGVGAEHFYCDPDDFGSKLCQRAHDAQHGDPGDEVECLLSDLELQTETSSATCVGAVL